MLLILSVLDPTLLHAKVASAWLSFLGILHCTPFVLDISHETPRSKPILKTHPCSYSHPPSSPVCALSVLLESLCALFRDH
jgi:hypothetical protein